MRRTFLVDNQWGDNFDPDIPSKATCRLRDICAQSQGRAYVLVHPYFRDQNVDHQYRNSLGDLITRARRANTPVLVLEEKRRIEETRQKLRRMLCVNTFIIPTIKYHAEPLIRYPPATYKQLLERKHKRRAQRDGFELALSKKRWEALVTFLKSIGIACVQIAGMYFCVRESDAKKEEPIVWNLMREYRKQRRKVAPDANYNYTLDDGCASLTCVILAKHFQVQVSQATTPHGINTIEQMENDRSDVT